MSIQFYIYAERSLGKGSWGLAEPRLSEPIEVGLPVDVFPPGQVVVFPPQQLGDENNRFLQAIFIGRSLPGDMTAAGLHRIPTHRGCLPVDLSAEMRHWSDLRLVDFYGYVGWVSLSEVKAFPWADQVVVSDFVREEYAHRFGDGKQPFPDDLSDKVEIFWPPYFSRAFGKKPDEPEPMARVSWVATHLELVGSAFVKHIDRLAELGSDTSEVRLIHWAG